MSQQIPLQTICACPPYTCGSDPNRIHFNWTYNRSILLRNCSVEGLHPDSSDILLSSRADPSEGRKVPSPIALWIMDLSMRMHGRVTPSCGLAACTAKSRFTMFSILREVQYAKCFPVQFCSVPLPVPVAPSKHRVETSVT